MSLVSINDLSIGYRGPLLLDSVSCRIEPGQRIGLLGRNGAGKTTLMKLLDGQVEPDGGTVTLGKGARVSLLPQDVPVDLVGAVAEIVAQGMVGVCTDEGEPLPEWEEQQKVQQILTRMELDGAARFEQLSSGMKRRVLLARNLVSTPDLLLLDEPTNHLDIDAILWLENFLSRWENALLFVTHDRMFLRKLADRILEIDRGQLFDWTCDYDTFLRRKEATLEAEDKQNTLFDKKLAQEETWIRQGIKARRTRNEGRVRALKKMREERQQRRTSPGKVNIKIDTGEKSGSLIAKVEKISFAYGDNVIVRDFSTTIMRGDKLGLIGPNGVGKTTLLRLLLGDLKPESGKVQLGTNIQLAYFDQLREQLNEEGTVQENVGDGSDTVKVAGRAVHVIGYLNDFLFTPERARTPVKFLSGGERNRVLLARLFAKPANVLVLDEPTNDLDAETLDLLESKLVEYAGTLLLVSHDRMFLNNVVTSSIAFEPGGVKEYVGGYDDWVRQRPAMTPTEESSKPRQETKSPSTTPKQRLSYNDKRELASLPGKIEEMEAQIAELHESMAEPGFYQQSGDVIAAETGKLQELETGLAAAYERWEELEAIDS